MLRLIGHGVNDFHHNFTLVACIVICRHAAIIHYSSSSNDTRSGMVTAQANVRTARVAPTKSRVSPSGKTIQPTSRPKMVHDWLTTSLTACVNRLFHLLISDLSSAHSGPLLVVALWLAEASALRLSVLHGGDRLLCLCPYLCHHRYRHRR